jgi:hypothetical protein
MTRAQASRALFLLMPLAANASMGCTATPDPQLGGSSSDDGDVGETTEITATGSTTIAMESSTSELDTSGLDTSESSSGSATGELSPCGGAEIGRLFAATFEVGLPSVVYPSAVASWRVQDGERHDAADDFEVPVESCWCITSVTIVAQHWQPSGIPEVVVSLYDDEGELPNDAWFTETTTAITMTEATGAYARMEIELAEPVLAPSGRSWLSVVELTETDDEHLFWSTSHTPSSSPSAARYDSDEACPGFAHWEDCVHGAVPIQLAFDIYGAPTACSSG